MNWLTIFSFAMATIFVSNASVGAQKPQRVPSQTAKPTPAAVAGEVLTAIDVALLMMGGSADADISKSLAGQSGFDRETVLAKGNSDEQIIRYLVIYKNPYDSVGDPNQFLIRKAEGDKYYQKKEYEKAAKEYTLAARYSTDKYEPYKLRADSYKQYLLTKLNPQAEASSDKAKQDLIDRSRTLLCHAIGADYAKARSLNNKALSDTVVQLNALRSRMASKEGQYDAPLKVDPTYLKSARQKKDMRQARVWENQVRACKHNDTVIAGAMSDSKLSCGKEDAARRQAARMERDRGRDKRWVMYGEKDGAVHFYDKAGVAKSKEYTNVPTRHENVDSEKAFDAATVRVSCKSKSVATMDLKSYDEIGNLASESHEKNPADNKVVKGSIEEMLLREVCK